jgi:hypothetical protein
MLISGCQTETVRLSAENGTNIKNVLIVAVEPLPLEVIPDLLETRQPVTRSLETMEVAFYATSGLYRYPGDILILGKMVSDDSVEKLKSTDPILARGKALLSNDPEIKSHWCPSYELASHTAKALTGLGMEATFNGLHRHLPINLEQRQTQLGHWHNAVTQWYDEPVSSLNYAAMTTTPVDVVIEVGLGEYRIFEGQVHLTVLMKVINPTNGKVLAKTGSSDYTHGSSTESLLLPDGSAFKQLISDMARKLIDNGVQRLGFLHRQPIRTPA